MNTYIFQIDLDYYPNEHSTSVVTAVNVDEFIYRNFRIKL